MKYLIMLFLTCSTVHATHDTCIWQKDRKEIRSITLKASKKLLKIERKMDALEDQYFNDPYMVYRLQELIDDIQKIKASLKTNE